MKKLLLYLSVIVFALCSSAWSDTWKCINTLDNTIIKLLKISIDKSNSEYLAFELRDEKWEPFLGQDTFNKFTYSEKENSLSREYKKSEYKKYSDVFNLLTKQYTKEIIVYHSQYSLVFNCDEVK